MDKGGCVKEKKNQRSMQGCIYLFIFSFLKSILNSEWIVSISCVFSWKVPDAGGSRPPGDESETVNERQSVREGCSAGEGVLSVSGLPREEFFQATVPCLPLCYLRARTADGSGMCSRTLDIDVCVKREIFAAFHNSLCIAWY